MEKQILDLLSQNNAMLKQILDILTDDGRNFSMNVLANLISETMTRR